MHLRFKLHCRHVMQVLPPLEALVERPGLPLSNESPPPKALRLLLRLLLPLDRPLLQTGKPWSPPSVPLLLNLRLEGSLPRLLLH